MSSKYHVTNGVGQGCVLSPLLFNVYVHDLSECLKSLRSVQISILEPKNYLRSSKN